MSEEMANGNASSGSTNTTTDITTSVRMYLRVFSADWYAASIFFSIASSFSRSSASSMPLVYTVRMGPEMVISLIAQFRYAFLVPGALLFGPVVALGAGILLRYGAFEFIYAWLALAGGELTGDILWYWLGHRYGDGFVRRFGKYVNITEKTIELVKREYHHYHDWIIFISKLTAGFGIAPAVFFTAGLSKVPFGRYMFINVIGQVFWTTGMLSLGYYLGELSLKVNTIFDRIFYGLGIVILVAAAWGFSRYLRNRFEKSVENEPAV